MELPITLEESLHWLWCTHYIPAGLCILFTLLALYWLFFSCIRREETIHGHWVSGLNVVKRPYTLSAVWLLASKSHPPVDFYLMFCLLCLMFCCVQIPRLRIVTTSLFPLGESLARLHHMFGPQCYFRLIVSVEPSCTFRLQKVRNTNCDKAVWRFGVFGFQHISLVMGFLDRWMPCVLEFEEWRSKCQKIPLLNCTF